MRIAATVLAAILVISTADAVAAGSVRASGVVHGCVNVKTRAVTIPAGSGKCGPGTQAIGWNVTGPAGPAGTTGWGLNVPGTGPSFIFFIKVVFDGQNLWADSDIAGHYAVDEVSPSRRTVVRALSGGRYGFNSPDAMAAGGGDVWVFNDGDSSVTEIRASDGAFVRKLSGSRYGFAPKAAMAVVGGRLWVTSPSGDSITEVSTRTGAVAGRLSGGKYGFKAPSALDVTGTHVWVANTAGNSVTEVNASTGAFVRRIDGFPGPAAMASDGSQLWVLGSSGDPVNTAAAVEINADTGTAIRRISGASIHVGGPVAAVAEGGRLWLASDLNDGSPQTVSEVDTSDGALVRTVSRTITDQPTGLAFDGQHVWMTSGANLTELPADGPGAAGPSVRGCVAGKTRALTIPAAGQSCASGSTAIGWSQDGPPGPAGAAGWPQVVTGASYGFDSPDSVTAAGGNLWVTSPKGDSMTEITGSDGALVRRLTGSQYGFSAPVAATTNGSRLWVANLDGDSVTEISASDGSLVRVISGAKYGFKQPVALTYDGGEVWVANAAGNSVTEISAADGSLVRVVSAAADQFRRPIAIAGDGTDLWVANSNGNSVTELSETDGGLVRTLSSGDNFGGPAGLAVSAGHLWVASRSNCTIAELSTSDGSLVHDVSLCAGLAGQKLEAISADSSQVWITESGPSSLNDSTGVVVLDATDASVVRDISDDGDGFNFASPFPAGLTEAGGHVWVASPGGKTVTELPQAGPPSAPATEVRACVSNRTRAVTVLNAGSGCPTATTAITWNVPGPAGPGTDPDLEPVFSGTQYQFSDPEALATDGSHLFVANAGGNSVTEVNASDGRLVRIVEGPGYAFSQPRAVIFDGSHLWVANTGGNSVTEINASDGSLVRVVSGSSYAFADPQALAFDGSHVWIANDGFAGNSLTEINASDGRLVRVVSGSSYKFGDPAALAFDGSNIWVSNANGDSLTEVSAADGSLVRVVSAGLRSPDSLVFDGSQIWVVDGSFQDEVTVLNASDGTVAGRLEDGCSQQQLVVDGSRVLADCGGVTELSLSTPSTDAPADQQDLGFLDPQGIVVAGGHAWVVNGNPDPEFEVGSLAELPLPNGLGARGGD